MCSGTGLNTIRIRRHQLLDMFPRREFDTKSSFRYQISGIWVVTCRDYATIGRIRVKISESC